MRGRATSGSILLAVGGLAGSLALPWYGIEPVAVEPDAWQQFVALLDRQRTLADTIRGWSAPGSAGPLLALAALLVVAGGLAAGTAGGRALLAIGSVGALAVCAFSLLEVPSGAYELRAGAFVSLACALLLLSAANRASAT